jgi:hypothetical protein
VAVQTWAAAYPDPGPVYTGPELPPLFDHPPQVERVVDRASDEAWALNHHSVDLDHLVLGMLHPKCPGAARAVLESFGVRAEVLRQAFIDSMGDPYDTKPRSVRYAEPTQRALERANLEAARLADAEVTSEHVLLALASRWESACFVTGWLARWRHGAGGAPAGDGRHRRGGAAHATNAAGAATHRPPGRGGRAGPCAQSPRP